MAEQTYTITAGSKEVYEVIMSEDGAKLTIRLANNHDRSFDMVGSVLPVLIDTLRQIKLPSTHN